MTILTFVAFCQRNNSEAGAPGTSSRHLNLPNVRKEHDEKDPNGPLFEGVGGNLSVNGNGVSKAVAAKFETGRKYRVTVELLEE